ncbi:hypothetical protein I3J09_29600 (plasmid) [Streptomyces clavuligerus]|uniref:Secreted protein n=3 Tax=Streptomyces clavuligerus TaxID=1901 RepID=D5SJZ5_STRCL|nr:hypothetical protein [Streptomyces clavuligerus]ANW22180.1 hypothetical protein BB341_27980 [Streptomyces clavuligerus]EFG04238.1 Hypothetical protein SCLAV_p0751 [Streptomyces clavuligerus]MBY6307285.1 hypothetical protein [Streptomyces clavuligerus]QPJ97810.1 hypothetical protein GE265_32720 [Streptomyces clavuligerus]QPL67323.1 hypothetical protein I3J04_30745 [Streptomyces clavuligerus]
MRVSRWRVMAVAAALAISTALGAPGAAPAAAAPLPVHMVDCTVGNVSGNKGSWALLRLCLWTNGHHLWADASGNCKRTGSWFVTESVKCDSITGHYTAKREGQDIGGGHLGELLDYRGKGHYEIKATIRFDHRFHDRFPGGEIGYYDVAGERDYTISATSNVEPVRPPQPEPPRLSLDISGPVASGGKSVYTLKVTNGTSKRHTFGVPALGIRKKVGDAVLSSPSPACGHHQRSLLLPPLPGITHPDGTTSPPRPARILLELLLCELDIPATSSREVTVAVAAGATCPPFIWGADVEHEPETGRMGPLPVCPSGQGRSAPHTAAG